jgi:Flp pilus assembly protein TadG
MAAHLIRRFLRRREGATAIEFALIAPVLLTFLLGIWEVGDRILVDNMLARVAVQTADLVAQEQDVTSAEMTDIREAARLSLNLSAAQQPLLIVEAASIEFNPTTGQPAIRWRNSNGPLQPLDPAIAAGLGGAGDSVIWVSVSFQYSSPVGLFAPATSTIVESAFARPRLSRVVSFNGVL